MIIKISKIQTNPDNQTRSVMFDPKHVTAIEMSLTGENKPELILPPISVEPIMGSDQYKIIDGHHRFEALRNMGRQEIQAVVHQDFSPEEKVYLGFNKNCDEKPRKTANMDELEIALTKLHKLGVDIQDQETQEEFRKKLHHKNITHVSRVANRIINGATASPVSVVHQTAIDNTYDEYEDSLTAVKHSQSTKWQQGLGYLIETMAESDKQQGILAIYFKNGIDKDKFNFGKVSLTIGWTQLKIDVIYLN